MFYLFCGNTSTLAAPLPINVTASQASVSDFVNAYVGFSPRALHSPARKCMRVWRSGREELYMSEGEGVREG